MNIKNIIKEEIDSNTKVVRKPIFILYSTYNNSVPIMLHGRPEYADNRYDVDWRWYRTDSFNADGSEMMVGQGGNMPATTIDTEESLERNNKKNHEALKELFKEIDLNSIGPNELKQYPKYNSKGEAEDALNELVKWVDYRINQKTPKSSEIELSNLVGSIKIVPMALETILTIMDVGETFFDKL